MVVLMEYAPGVAMAMKRKGAEEPGLFSCGDGDGDGDLAGVPLTCRATKMRRLQSAGAVHDVPAAAASVGMAEGDVVMGEEAVAPPAPSLGDADGEKAMVVYDPADAAGWRLGQWRRRLEPSWAHLRVGAEWIRDMLREADSRTVRAVLASAQEEGVAADLAVVPWGAAAPATATTEVASTATETVPDKEEDADETAAMDVEAEETGHHHTPHTFTTGCGEGYLYRWPQHCMPQTPPQPVPVVGNASPAMCRGE